VVLQACKEQGSIPGVAVQRATNCLASFDVAKQSSKNATFFKLTSVAPDVAFALHGRLAIFGGVPYHWSVFALD